MTDSPENVSLPLASETVNSFTGFDEIAIARYFQKDMSELPATTSMRAMLFVLKRREGTKDSDAYKFVMSMPLGEVTGSFADEPSEDNLEESDEGND